MSVKNVSKRRRMVYGLAAVLLAGGLAVTLYNLKSAPLEIEPENVSDDE